MSKGRTQDSTCETQQAGESEEEQIDPWQQYFSQLFPKLFIRIEKIRNYKVQAEFCQKSRTGAAEGPESAGNAPRQSG